MTGYQFGKPAVRQLARVVKASERQPRNSRPPRARWHGGSGDWSGVISPSTTGACGCSSVTGVIPATTAAFGTDYLLAYRWQLPGIMSVLNDHGFSLTVEPTLIYDGGEWVSEVLTRHCGSSITDDYYITLEEHATHSWLLRIGLPDGATPSCDDLIEWFAVFNGPLGTAYPAAINPLRWSILSKREEQST